MTIVSIENWIETYSPKTLNDYKHHIHQKSKIDTWFKYSNTMTLFLYGQMNVGKTTLIKLFLKKYNIEVFEVGVDDLYSVHLKNTKTKLVNLSNNNSVHQYFTQNKTYMLLENFSAEHNGFMNFLKFTYTLDKCIPIIVISNDLPKNLYSIPQFKSKTECIYLPKLKMNDIFNFISTILEKEKFKMDNSIIWNISKSSQTLFEAMQLVIQYITKELLQPNTQKENPQINLNWETTDCFYHKNKNKLVSTLVSTKKDLDFNEKLRIWSCDPSHMTQIFYENVPTNNLSNTLLGMEHYIFSKICESYIYSHQEPEAVKFSQFLEINLLNLYSDELPLNWVDIPKINSKSCQHYYQLKSQQIIHHKFGKSSKYTYLICDNLLHDITKGKKQREKIMNKYNLVRSDINAIKRLSITKIPKIKF